MFDVLGDLDERKGLLERACKMLHLTNLEFVSINTHEFNCSEITDSLAVNWAELFDRSMDVTGVQAIGHGACKQPRAGPHYSKTNNYEARREKGEAWQHRSYFDASHATGHEHYLTCACSYFPETEVPLVKVSGLW